MRAVKKESSGLSDTILSSYPFSFILLLTSKVGGRERFYHRTYNWNLFSWRKEREQTAKCSEVCAVSDSLSFPAVLGEDSCSHCRTDFSLRIAFLPSSLISVSAHSTIVWRELVVRMM